MPRLVKFKDQSTITYTYAADGTKLRVEHKIGNSTTRTTYCSNVIYEGGEAKCLLMGEGYVSLDNGEFCTPDGGKVLLSKLLWIIALLIS